MDDNKVHIMITSTDEVEVLALIKEVEEEFPDSIIEILMGSDVDTLDNEPLLLVKTLCDEKLLYKDESDFIEVLHILIQRHFEECVKYIISKYDFNNLVLQRVLAYCREYDLDVKYGDDWIEPPEDIEYDTFIPLLVDGMSEEINKDNMIEIALTDKTSYYKMDDIFCHIAADISLCDVADYISDRD